MKKRIRSELRDLELDPRPSKRIRLNCYDDPLKYWEDQRTVHPSKLRKRNQQD